MNMWFLLSAGDDVSIDGTDIVVKLDWKYSDGSDVIYIKWAPTEPSSALCGGCDERCLVLQNEFLWSMYFKGMNNMKCGDSRPYICQLHIYAWKIAGHVYVIYTSTPVTWRSEDHLHIYAENNVIHGRIYHVYGS